MVVAKHIEKKDRERGYKDCEYIFGGYSQRPWEDSLSYCGDHQTYVFSMAPRFKCMYSFRGDGGTNYTYLNTRKIEKSVYKMGLG